MSDCEDDNNWSDEESEESEEEEESSDSSSDESSSDSDSDDSSESANLLEIAADVASALRRRSSSSSSSSSSDDDGRIDHIKLDEDDEDEEDENEDYCRNLLTQCQELDLEGDTNDWENDGKLDKIISLALKGFKKKKKWCRMFKGKCFTNGGQLGHSRLPECTVSGAGETITVPSMYVKDIKGVHEYTQKVSTSEGTFYVAKVQMEARKFNTEPLDLSGLFKGLKATKIGRRYYLDASCGSDTSSNALAAIVNKDDGEELVMPVTQLLELLSFIRKVNKKGGYACCEVARVGPRWFSILNLHLLGHHDGRAEFMMSEKAKSFLPVAVAGKRYLKEFQEGRVAGTRNGHRMVEEYTSNLIRSSECTQTYIPTRWPGGEPPEDPHHPRLEVPCLELTYTAIPSGGIQNSERRVGLLITKPLHGVAFTSQSRPSQCMGLNIADAAVHSSGYRTALSALGASLSKQKPAEYFRIEPELQTRLVQVLKSPLGIEEDVLSLHCTRTALSHKAGKRGTFPIFKGHPILRIAGKWYHFDSLKPYEMEEYQVPKRLRYIDIAVDAKKVKRKRPKTSTEQASQATPLRLPTVKTTTVQVLQASQATPLQLPTVETCPETISVVSEITTPTLLDPPSAASHQKKEKKKKKPGLKQDDADDERVVVSKVTKIKPDGSRIVEIEYSDGTKSVRSSVTGNDKKGGDPEASVPSGGRRIRPQKDPSVSQESDIYVPSARHSKASKASSRAHTSKKNRKKPKPVADVAVISRSKEYKADGSCIEIINYSDGTKKTITHISVDASVESISSPPLYINDLNMHEPQFSTEEEALPPQAGCHVEHSPYENYASVHEPLEAECEIFIPGAQSGAAAVSVEPSPHQMYDSAHEPFVTDGDIYYAPPSTATLEAAMEAAVVSDFYSPYEKNDSVQEELQHEDEIYFEPPQQTTTERQMEAHLASDIYSPYEKYGSVDEEGFQAPDEIYYEPSRPAPPEAEIKTSMIEAGYSPHINDACVTEESTNRGAAMHRGHLVNDEGEYHYPDAEIFAAPSGNHSVRSDDENGASWQGRMFVPPVHAPFEEFAERPVIAGETGLSKEDICVIVGDDTSSAVPPGSLSGRYDPDQEVKPEVKFELVAPVSRHFSRRGEAGDDEGAFKPEETAATSADKEEAEALEMLVDMLPQYSRTDLKQELLERESAEAVIEAVFAGHFGSGTVAADSDTEWSRSRCSHAKSTSSDPPARRWDDCQSY